jgi:hypothetical protein
MKYLLVILLFITFAEANNKSLKYEPNSTCKSCHPKIYDEYEPSMHQNAVSFEDPIHGAVWNKHPKNLKKGKYGCAKCHIPAASNLDDMIAKGKKAMPDMGNETHKEGVSCAYCHRIKSIELHKKSNTNIMSEKEHSYYGTLVSKGSVFHAIVTEGNEHIRNGNVCIGCHSHKMNKFGLNVCSTNIENEMDGANCVSCHMPQVKGSVSTLTQRETHAFHGFAGTHFHQEMLAQYVDLNMTQEGSHFSIMIHNRASHSLMLHPLRVVKLLTSVKRGEKTTVLKEHTFARVIGKNGKPAMPWVADKEIKNSMISHHEKRTVAFDFELKKGDEVEVTLGYYLVNPKVLQSLKLQNNEVATRFNLLKTATFKVK